MIVDGLATQGVIQGDNTWTGLALKMRASFFRIILDKSSLSFEDIQEPLLVLT